MKEKRKKKLKTINMERMDCIRKGFLSIRDIEKFCPCGYQRAREVYYDICKEVESENKYVSPFGITTVRLLKYLNLKESDIRKHAEEERQLLREETQLIDSNDARGTTTDVSI